MTEYKIETREAIALIVNLLCNKFFVLAPFYIKNAAGNAVPIMTLIYFLIAFALWRIYIRLYNSGTDLIDNLKNRFGKIIVGTIIIIALTAVVTLTLRQYSEGIKVMTLTKTPVYFIVAVFSVAMFLGARCGLKSICKSGGFFVPIIYIIALLLVIATVKGADLYNFFPVFGAGLVRIFSASVTMLSMLFELIILFFLPPLLKNPDDFKKIGNHAFLWSFIFFITIGSIFAISTSGVNIKNYEPFFRIIKQIETGSILQRCDSVFLILYCISAFLYLSAILFFVTHIASKTFNINDQMTLVLPMGLLISSSSAVNIIEEYMFAIIGNTNYFLWIVTFITPLLVIFSYKLRSLK